LRASPAIFSERNCHAQVGCRKGGGILTQALVLAMDQIFQLLLQIRGSAVLFCSLECIHRWPVVFPEFVYERGRPAWEVEGKCVAREGYLLFPNSCAGKSRDDTALDPPCHWTDKTFGRWRRVG